MQMIKNILRWGKKIQLWIIQMQQRTDLKLPADKTPFENIPMRSLKTYNTQLPEKTKKKKSLITV